MPPAKDTPLQRVTPTAPTMNSSRMPVSTASRAVRTTLGRRGPVLGAGVGGTPAAANWSCAHCRAADSATARSKSSWPAAPGGTAPPGAGAHAPCPPGAAGPGPCGATPLSGALGWPAGWAPQVPGPGGGLNGPAAQGPGWAVAPPWPAVAGGWWRASAHTSSPASTNQAGTAPQCHHGHSPKVHTDNSTNAPRTTTQDRAVRSHLSQGVPPKASWATERPVPCSGTKAQASAYRRTPPPTASNQTDSTTKPTRTTPGLTPRYSARPPRTPAMRRLVVLRRHRRGAGG